VTTVAANRECMAADRLYSIEDGSFMAPKLWVHEGSIYSSSGNSADFLLFQRYVMGIDKDRPIIKDEDSFSVLRLSTDGIWYYDYACLGVRIDDDYFAIGGGKLAALCLMSTGMHPVDAVRTVAKHHDGTKGRVDCINLADLPPPTKGRTRARKGS